MEQTIGQETAEQMQARHRKEARELQGRITSKKKNATKKTRKGINDECDQLERQLRERHDEELRGPAGGPGADAGAEAEGPDVAAVSEELRATSLSAGPGSDGGDPSRPNGAVASPSAPEAGGGGQKKRNRQKERLARRAAEQEAAAVAAASEAEGMVDHRATEQQRMGASIAAHGLVEHAIEPDGHCLFAAVADQLAQEGIAVSSAADGPRQGQQERQGAYQLVRAAAAGYMAGHPDDFAPFLDEGETLDAYVAKIRDTAEWGGHLELAALAGAYGVELRVVQDGRLEEVRPPDGVEAKGPIWLAYYRHGYGLGEHYNSLRKAKTGRPS